MCLQNVTTRSCVNVGLNTCVKCLILRVLCTIRCVCVSLSLFHSACEGRDVWGDRCPSLLQQEQDRGEISNCQMFLLPWTGCWHHPGHALLCWWYVPQFVCFFNLNTSHLNSNLCRLRELTVELSRAAVNTRTRQVILALARGWITVQPHRQSNVYVLNVHTLRWSKKPAVIWAGGGGS